MERFGPRATARGGDAAPTRPPRRAIGPDRGRRRKRTSALVRGTGYAPYEAYARTRTGSVRQDVAPAVRYYTTLNPLPVTRYPLPGHSGAIPLQFWRSTVLNAGLEPLNARRNTYTPSAAGERGRADSTIKITYTTNIIRFRSTCSR